MTRSTLEPYGLALLAVMTTLLVKFLAAPLVELDTPFPLFLCAVIVSAWYGGLGPGLFATGLSALAATALQPSPGPPVVAPAVRHLAPAAVFLAEGALVSVLIAQGKQAWRRAEDQRDWLSAILVEMGDAVVALDPDGRVTYLNPVAQRLTGWPLAEGVGQPAAAVLRLLDAGTRERIPEVDPAGRPRACLLLARNGTQTFIDQRATPLRDRDGDPAGTLVVFRDKTEWSERRRSEANLRESEGRFRAMADAAPVLIWTAGPDANCDFFNQPWYRFTGRTPEQERGHGWAEGVHPDDRGRCLGEFEAAFDARRDFEVEFRLRRHDGEYRFVLNRGTPRFTPEGTFLGYIGSAIDITDRKRAQQSLGRSEARFRQLADAMPQIVWTAGPGGRVDYYNQRWTDYTGLSAEQTFAADGWWQLVLHPDDVAGTAFQWAEAVRTGKPFQVECRFRHPNNGGYHWFLARAVPVREAVGGGDAVGGAGSPPPPADVRWYGTCTDIDEQKRSEEELKEASRRKDEFLAMLSHELRNPLAAARNSLELLHLGELADPAMAAARDVIDRQVKHLSRMVDDLLDIFRIIHRKISMSREPLDLAAAVRRTAEDFRPALESAGLTLDFEVPADPVWVSADRTRLAQVVGNLLQNAAKFTNAGDRITVRVAAEKHRATVAVRDTGIGMTPEVLDEVFEMFAQVRQPLAREHGGLGLGLALVKGLVELHGGQVRAHSAGPGRGSEFTFWLPLSRKPTAAAAPAPAAPPGEGRRLRLLIVEDNEDTAETLQLLLHRFGHDVRVAHTGTAGVGLARAWRPDVVLCDLGLPELDGYGVARELRADPALAGVRLIAVSGYGQEEDRRRSEDVGFDLHLTKPVDPMELKQLLGVIHVKESGVRSQ